MTSQKPNEVGVAAIWQNQRFLPGQAKWAAKMAETMGIGKKAQSSFSGIGKIASGSLSSGFAVAAAATVAVVAGFAAIVAGGIKVISTLNNIAKETAPLYGIGLGFEANAGKYGVSIDKMRAASGGMLNDWELMQKANVALTGATQTFGQEFGNALPALIGGARVAARNTGQEFDFMFQSLVTGIKRSSPLLIDNTGLVLDMAAAKDKLATELGITVDQLSSEQEQIAVLNATVEASQQLMKDYGSDQLTAAEQMARVDAQSANLKNTLGTALQPALATVQGAWADLLQKFADSALQGGEVQNIFVKIGTAASFMADGVAAAIGLVGDVMQSLVTTVDGAFSGTLDSAFEWGFNLIEQFAGGIMDAISSVLVWAMNALTSMLTGWMAPGSPPKVAPDIDKWGMGAMNEYVKGMTDAEFGMLKDLQSPLKQALGFLEQTGGIGEGAAGGIFANISKQIAAGIDSGDLTSAFESLGKSAGEFGPELVKLAEGQLAVATATDAVTSAEQRLAAARQSENAATDETLKQVSEYNKLLREGGTKQELNDKLAMVTASGAAEQAAIAETAAAEDALQLAKEQQQAAEDSLTSQENAVNQMLQLYRELMGDAPTAAAGAAGGGGGAGAGGGPLGGLGDALSTGMDGITTMMTEKVAAMKAAIVEKLSTLWDSIVTKWDTTTGESFAKISEAWTTLVDTAKQWYDEKIVPMWEGFTDWLNTYVTPAVEGLIEVATALGDYVSENLIAYFNNWSLAAEEVWGWLNDVWEKIDLDLSPAIEWLRDGVLAGLQEGIKTINGLLSTFASWLSTIATRIRNMPKLTDYTKESPVPLAEGIKEINAQMNILAKSNMPALAQSLNRLQPQNGLAPVTTTNVSNRTANISMQNSFAGMTPAQVESVVRRVIRSEMR